MVVANNQVLVWYKCLRKRTKLKMHCTRCAVYLSAPSFWLYQACDRPDSPSYSSRTKQIKREHRSLGPISFFKHLYTLSPGRFLLGQYQYPGYNSGWLGSSSGVCGCLSRHTAEFMTYSGTVNRHDESNTKFYSCHPCSFEIISILYQNDSRSWPSISCPSYSLDLRAELRRYRLKAL